MSAHTFPEILDTARLRLRPYRTADAPSMLALIDHNREILVREFAAQAALHTVAQAEAFVAQKAEAWKAAKTFCYGIWERKTDAQVGQIQVKNIDWDIPAAELGYFIARSAQRQGYASEATQRILKCAFRERLFQRIFVRILPSNPESFRLAKQLGFCEEGVHRNAYRCGLGQLHDVRYLSLTPGDYRRLQPDTHNAVPSLRDSG